MISQAAGTDGDQCYKFVLDGDTAMRKGKGVRMIEFKLVQGCFLV